MRVHNAHDDIIEDTVQQLWLTGRYHHILTKEEYDRYGFHGELDAHAFPYVGQSEYWEAKSHDNPKAWARAVVQFERAHKAYHGQLRFFYVTPERTVEYLPGIPSGRAKQI